MFGFPSIVRFSWKTAETQLEEKGVKMEFEEEEPTEDPSVAATPSVKQWFQPAAAAKSAKPGGGVSKRPRTAFFKERNLVRSTLRDLLNKA